MNSPKADEDPDGRANPVTRYEWTRERKKTFSYNRHNGMVKKRRPRVNSSRQTYKVPTLGSHPLYRPGGGYTHSPLWE